MSSIPKESDAFYSLRDPAEVTVIHSTAVTTELLHLNVQYWFKRKRKNILNVSYVLVIASGMKHSS